MAKAKPDTPKKGKTSAPVKKAATALRRSPRKVVQSAKKLDAEKDIAPGKVIERTATKKPPVATEKTPVAVKASAKAAGNKTSKSPSPKKPASIKVKQESSPAPKRGRSKKEAKPESVTPKTATPSRCRVSSRTRSQTPEDVAEVPVPVVDEEWTDSPKKRSPSKASSNKAAATKPSTGKKTTASTTKAGPASIRKSIELPQTKTKETSPSRVRKPSASPTRGRSKTISSPKARAKPAKSIVSPKRAQSHSPARKSPDKSTGTASARAQSRSPARKSTKNPTTQTLSKTRSQSPVKRSPKNSTTTDIVKFLDAVTRSTRGRSASPAKKSSPDKGAGARSPTLSTKARSKSPSKGNARKASQVSSSTSPMLPPPVHSPKIRGRPRSSSTGRQLSPIRVEKTRASSNPKKKSPNKLRRTRSARPKKSERSQSGTRKLSDPTPIPGPGRGLGRPRSPSKPVQGQTQVQRRPSTQAAFETRFLQNDDYGRALKQVERTAYRCQRDGEDPMAGRDPHVSREDETMAKERGIRRAELEKSLHTKGAIVPRRSLSATQARGRVDDSDDLRDDIAGRGKVAGVNGRSSTSLSPQRRRSSGDSRRSPSGSPGRKRSVSRGSNKDNEDFVPLPKGEPSGEGRGAIHSVTNPELIPDTSTLRKNPFFETMPAPEVWHRRMPPFLPFGETPFMEKEMSRQISEDLAREAEQAQASWSSSFSKLFGMSKKSPVREQPHRSPWTLPEIADADVTAAVSELHNVIETEAGMGGTKRKASRQLSRSPVKRARRRSAGNRDEDDYRMSGAL